MSPAGRRAAGAALAFLAVGVGLFHEALFGGRQFFYRDLALQWHPQVEAFVRSVGAGSWPLWNPWISFGQPLLANPNAQLLYPVTWLQLLVPAWTYYAWYVLLHAVLAGCGMSALGRHLGLSRGGALAAGLVWVLCGPFLSLVNLWHHLAGAAWLPWATLAADRALTEPSTRRAVAWGGCMALLVVTGSPESVLMGLVIAIVLCVVHAPDWWRERSRLRPVLGGTALAAALAAGLAAGQWLPTVDVARASSRADLPVAAREFWSVHPWSLGQIAFPVFPDRLPLQPAWRERLFDSREPFLLSIYVGVPVLALVCGGLTRGATRRVWWALAALAVLSILFALGRHGPAYPVLVAAIPPLRTLRYPSKAVVLAAFCLALLAGRGFDAWRDREGSDRRWAVLGGVLLAAAIAAVGAGWALHARAERWGAALLLSVERPHVEVLARSSRSLMVSGALTLVLGLLALVGRRWWSGPAVGAAALAVAAIDLGAAQRGLNPTAPAGALDRRPPVLSAARPAPYQRLYVFDYARGRSAERLLGHAGFALTRPRGAQEPWHAELALIDYAHPALLGLWGLEGSYGVDALKLLSHDVNTVNALVELNESAPGPTHRLLRMGAVDTVIAMHRQGFEELRPLAALPPTYFPEPILAFRVPDALPRAYVVGRARIAPPGQGWRALMAPDFDPAREIVLPEGPVLDGAAGGTARILELRPDTVTLEAELDAPGYVVLVDAYDEGWAASVDGRPAPLLRANVAFRAVQAAAGRHVIRFAYRPTSAIAGLAISLLAALGAAVLWARA